MNPPFDSIIFDLDGTLWDTCSSCAIAWNNVLRTNQIPFREITADDIRKVAGKTHELCIRETFKDLSEEQIQKLILGTEVEDNMVIAKLGGDLYPGVPEGLKLLSKAYSLFIVSNCQSGYIETFLKYSGLKYLFVDFECWGNTGKSKSHNLAAIIQRNNVKVPLYVGDTEGDLKAARDCNIPFYFAEYGFGNIQESEASFSSFGDLAKILSRKS